MGIAQQTDRIRGLLIMLLSALLLCSCGLYVRWPKKAKPDQRVWGESVENVSGKTRIHDERDMISWRAPDGHRWEQEVGSCTGKTRDDMSTGRVCSWKVVEDESAESDDSD